MQSLTRKEAAELLLRHDRFLILTHRRPDGDTLGSAALLCRGLRQLGKTAFVLENRETTKRYRFLCEGLTVDTPPVGSFVITVDVATTQLLSDEVVEQVGKIALRIDHHHNTQDFSDYEVNDPISAACGQIVYHILQHMGAELDEPMAIALYTAVATDTGCFRFSNAQPETYEVAAACARVTPYLRELNHALFDTVSLGRLRLQGWIVENAQFLQDGKVCICPIPLEIEEKLNLTEDDMENISGFPRTIEGVQIAATLRQEHSGKIKVSVRALPVHDASAICARFGGGGHKGAAGASLDMSMEEAVEALIAVIPTIA